MENKIANVLNKHATFSTVCRAAYGALRLHLGFVLLGVLCLAFSLMALVMFAVFARATSRRIGRKLIARLFQFYLRLLVIMGACQFDLALNNIVELYSAGLTPGETYYFRVDGAQSGTFQYCLRNYFFGGIAHSIGSCYF